MTLLFGDDSKKSAAVVDTELAMRMPLGAISPLWAMYAATAGAGVAFWWMTQWMRPVNLEALMGVTAVLPSSQLLSEEEIPIEPIGGEAGPLQGAALAIAAASEPLEALAEAVAEVFSPEAPPSIEIAPPVIESDAPPKATPKPKAPSSPRKI